MCAMAVELRSSVKYGTVLSFTVFLLAYWFRSPQSVLDERLGAVLSSLLRAESKVGMNNVARPRVAVGNYSFRKPLTAVPSVLFLPINVTWKRLVISFYFTLLSVSISIHLTSTNNY